MVKTVATSHMWLLGTLSVASVIKTLGFFVFSSFFYFLFFFVYKGWHGGLKRIYFMAIVT